MFSRRAYDARRLVLIESDTADFELLSRGSQAKQDLVATR